MSAPSTSRNIFFALVLSLAVTTLAAIAYAIYPLISALVMGVSGSRAGAGSGGIGAVAGGVSESFLLTMLVVGPICFLIIFALFRRRGALS